MYLEEIESDYGFIEADEFTGFVFGESGNLQVVGVLPKHSTDHPPKYVVQCSICKLDPELFGDGMFTSNIRIAIKRQYSPCGCKKQYSFSKEQHEVLLVRKCERDGLIFKGWVEPLPIASFSKSAKILVDIDGSDQVHILNNFYKKSFDSNERGTTTTQAYLNIILDRLSNSPICIKYGISRDFKIRLREQNSRTPHKVINGGAWQFPDKYSTLKAEQACRLKFGTKFLHKKELPDGYTETTSYHNFEAIVEEYERLGGVRIA